MKFQNRYRIDSIRLKQWNYGWSAFYFITICTQNRACVFGSVSHGTMILNEIGKIAQTEWIKTFEMRPDMNLVMGEFVVMPNHFHAIIGIGKNQYNCGRDAMHSVSTKNTNITKNRFGPQSKNLASIIRGYKIGVTKHARMINPHFAWQSGFYDCIIRDNGSFQRISQYIINNPLKW